MLFTDDIQDISNNICYNCDLLDHSDWVDSGALILFLDFCIAFDTTEHGFILHSPKDFGFGNKNHDQLFQLIDMKSWLLAHSGLQ